MPSSRNWCGRRGRTGSNRSPRAESPAAPAASGKSRCLPSTGCWAPSSAVIPCRQSCRPAWGRPCPTLPVLSNLFSRSDRFECCECLLFVLSSSFLTEKPHVMGAALSLPPSPPHPPSLMKMTVRDLAGTSQRCRIFN